MVDVSMERFEELVSEALDRMPQNLMARLDNVIFLVEEEGEHPDVLGLYDGIPITEREAYGAMVMPDQVFLYRRALCAMCETEEELIAEVRVTVIHEIAHYFGIDDDRLHELGWD